MHHAPEKFKIFLWDYTQLGMDECYRYLGGQTYCFSLESGPGFGLFYNPRRRKQVWLVQDPAFTGCIGELWEVEEPRFHGLHQFHRLHGAQKVALYFPGMPPVWTWVTPLSALKGARARQIWDYRDPHAARPARPTLAALEAGGPAQGEGLGKLPLPGVLGP